MNLHIYSVKRRSYIMTGSILVPDRVPTSDIQLTGWVNEVAELTKPDHITWCDGSYPEWERLTNLLVEQGTFTRLNPQIRPNSFHCVSDPSDVARVEDRTFICSEKQEDAGPTKTGSPRMRCGRLSPISSMAV